MDPDAGKVVGTIPQLHGVHGIAIANDLNRGFITNGSNTSNSVTIFDLKTLQKIGEPAAGKGPDAVCYEPKTKRVFAINHGGTDATAIDAKTGEVLKSFPTGPTGEFCATDGNGTLFVNLEDSVGATADRRRQDGSDQAHVARPGRRSFGPGDRREEQEAVLGLRQQDDDRHRYSVVENRRHANHRRRPRRRGVRFHSRAGVQL